MEFTFPAIGIIHSCFKEKFGIPRQPGLAPLATAELELLPPYNDPTALEGERVSSSIMLGAQHPDAIICYNDLMALGFMKEAQTLGFRVPEDISVAGFDNIQFGRYTSPPLTSVDLQSERMGVAGMNKLLAAIEGEVGNDFTVVEPQLVLRSSTIRRKSGA